MNNNEVDETALFQSNDNMNQAFNDRIGLLLMLPMSMVL